VNTVDTHTMPLGSANERPNKPSPG